MSCPKTLCAHLSSTSPLLFLLQSAGQSHLDPNVLSSISSCSNLCCHPQEPSQTLGLTFCALCSSSLRNSEPFSRISTEELRRRDTLSCSVDWVSSTPPASWHPASGSSLLPLDGISGFQCPTTGCFWLSSSKLAWLWGTSTGELHLGATQSLLTLHPSFNTPSSTSSSQTGRVTVYEEARIGLEDLLCAQQHHFLHPARRHCLPIEVLHPSAMDCLQTSNRRGNYSLK